MERKALTEVKVNDEGDFEAVFATMDVVDLHSDVMVSGSIGKQTVAIGGYNHGSTWDTHLPAGKGQTEERNGKAYVTGRFFLNTDQGRNMHATLKEMGKDQQWSFNLRDIKADWADDGVRRIKKVKVDEVSPVLVGAGIRTRTTRIKSNSGNDLGLDIVKGIGRRRGL